MKTLTKEIIKGRIFIVGCPRSGTTLLQSLLAAHPEISSFPESFFFNYLVPSRPWLIKLGIASRWVKPQFKKFLHESHHDNMEIYLPKFGIFMEQYAQAFVQVLDILTTQQGKNLWLEKTPWHVHYIDYIEQFVEQAKFIHIIRNGQDVVASLYEVTNKYPELWHGAKDIDRCVDIWIKAVQSSQNHLHKHNHTLVRYEELVENPQLVLEELCKYIDVSFNQRMLQDYNVAAKQVVLKNEPWKASVCSEIKNTNNSKFFNIFDKYQRDYILKKLSVYSLSELVGINN